MINDKIIIIIKLKALKIEKTRQRRTGYKWGYKKIIIIIIIICLKLMAVQMTIFVDYGIIMSQHTTHERMRN